MTKKPENFEGFFAEVCRLEPALAEREAELRKLYLDLLNIQSAIIVDRKFVKNLKNTIMKKAKSNEIKIRQPFWSWKLAAAATAVCLIVVAVIGTKYGWPRAGFEPTDDKLVSQPNQNIQKIAFEAFGQLGGQTQPVFSSIDETGESVPSVTDSTVSVGRGGGGGFAEGEVSQMIMPDYYQPYRFAYQGDQFELPDGQLPVYRRSADNTQAEKAAGTLVKQGGILSILRGRDGLRLDSLSLVDEEGYQYSIGYYDQTLGIHLAYPIMETKCIQGSGRPGCILPPVDPQKIAQLNDEQIFKIADDFLEQFDFDISNYGEPVLDETWQAYRTDPESQFGHPTYVNVTYPLIIEGYSVYEQGGQPYGIQVGINLAGPRVESVWGHLGNSFEASDYSVSQDTARLIKAAENLVYYTSDSRQLKIIGLGTPELVYVNWYHFDQQTGRGQQLLVPGLRFEALEKPEQPYYYQSALIVPLVEYLLDEMEDQYRYIDVGVPAIEPMPVIEQPDIEEMVETNE